MSALPVIDRELQVASRRKTTFRGRLLFAGTGVALVALLLTFHELTRIIAGSARPVGGTLFAISSTISAFLCLLAGVFLTADTISSEKRDGTLGLLFLTRLSCLDILIGKLAASSLVAFHGLLAVLPVFAIAFVAGGVSGGEFWRMALALLLLLFLSLSLGLCVSAASRDPSRAMAATAGAALVCAAWPLGAYTLFSQAFHANHALHPERFWWAAGVCLGGTLLLLAAASFLLARSWRSAEEKSAAPAAHFRLFGRRTVFRQANRHLLNANPIAWLAARRSTHLWTVLSLVLLAALPLTLLVGAGPGPGMVTSWLATAVFAVILKILVGLRASQFFADARRDGTLEFLLATPVSPSQVLQGLRTALKRHYGPATLIVCSVPVAAALMSYFLDPTPDGSTFPWLFVLPAGVFRIAEAITGIYMAGWVGSLVGLTVRRPASAPWFTLLFTVLLPLPFGCLTTLIFNVPVLLWARARVPRKLQQLSRPQTGLTVRDLLAPVPPPPPATPPRLTPPSPHEDPRTRT
jgi:ABC-type transport system involved in multi-copper enzyme maturation permease subunit